MISPENQRQLLHAIYDGFDEWSARFSFACRKGCASCCTQSVTMTTLEGREIIDFLAEQGRKAELRSMATRGSAPHPGGKRMTTNDFVAAHLRGEGVADEVGWNTASCPFLLENTCSIYAARPFGCRCFVSFSSCALSAAATMPPGYLSASTIMLQLIEHLDVEGCWGGMLEVLALLEGAQGQAVLPVTQSLPGFLVAPEEQAIVEPLLAEVLARRVDEKPLNQWLKELRQHGNE